MVLCVKNTGEVFQSLLAASDPVFTYKLDAY